MQQFKVGDWVYYAGEFYRVHEEYNGKGNISKEVVNSLVRHDKNVQLWQPKQGEWCWFWNKRLVQELHLSQFSNVFNDTYYTHTGNDFDHCEPFIGELPSFLKDNQ